MRTPFHVQVTDDLSAFATFCGKPGFTADTWPHTGPTATWWPSILPVRSQRAAPYGGAQRRPCPTTSRGSSAITPPGRPRRALRC